MGKLCVSARMVGRSRGEAGKELGMATPFAFFHRSAIVWAAANAADPFEERAHRLEFMLSLAFWRSG